MSLSNSRYVRLLRRAFTLELVYIYASVLLAAGLVSYLLNASVVPATAVFVPRNFQAQSVIETIIYSFTIVMGAGGVYLLSRSASEQQMKRETSLLFAGGIALLIISFIMMFGLYSLKFS
jgi:hypothetical protein